MISKQDATQLSKFFSYALRHSPQEVGLQIDKEGWVELQSLILAARSNGYQCDRTIAVHIVQTNAKKRFQLNSGADKIRAVQGHTNDAVDRTFEESIPPHILYHGTTVQNTSMIMIEGLKKMTRQYVHLSINRKIAKEVGRRWGEVQLLEINAKQMHQDGYKFYVAENQVWLVDSVPNKYIRTIK